MHRKPSETQRFSVKGSMMSCQGYLVMMLGFTGFLDRYAGLLDLMCFGIATFDFQHRSTQPTG